MSCSCSCRWPHIPSPVPPPSVAAIPETWALYLLVYSDVHQCQNWITHHQDRSHLQCLIGRCRAPHQPWCPAQQGAALLPVQRTLMFRYLHSWIQRTTNIISERKVAIKNHTNQTVFIIPWRSACPRATFRKHRPFFLRTLLITWSGLGHRHKGHFSS